MERQQNYINQYLHELNVVDDHLIDEVSFQNVFSLSVGQNHRLVSLGRVQSICHFLLDGRDLWSSRDSVRILMPVKVCEGSNKSKSHHSFDDDSIRTVQSSSNYSTSLEIGL